MVSPLSDSIARAVAGDLVVLLGTPEVANSQLANFAPDLQSHDRRATLRFNTRTTAVVEAVWTVRKTAGGEIRSGRTVAREAVQGQGFDALAAAHSQAIAKNERRYRGSDPRRSRAEILKLCCDRFIRVKDKMIHEQYEASIPA